MSPSPPSFITSSFIFVTSFPLIILALVAVTFLFQNNNYYIIIMIFFMIQWKETRGERSQEGECIFFQKAIYSIFYPDHQMKQTCNNNNILLIKRIKRKMKRWEDKRWNEDLMKSQFILCIVALITFCDSGNNPLPNLNHNIIRIINTNINKIFKKTIFQHPWILMGNDP